MSIDVGGCCEGLLNYLLGSVGGYCGDLLWLDVVLAGWIVVVWSVAVLGVSVVVGWVYLYRFGCGG